MFTQQRYNKFKCEIKLSLLNNKIIIIIKHISKSYNLSKSDDYLRIIYQ